MARLDKYTHGDKSMTMAEWSRFLKVPVSTLRDSYLKIGFRKTMQRFYRDPVKREPVNVPYLSPIVIFNNLRKGALLTVYDVKDTDLSGFYKDRAGAKKTISKSQIKEYYDLRERSRQTLPIFIPGN